MKKILFSMLAVLAIICATHLRMLQTAAQHQP